MKTTTINKLTFLGSYLNGAAGSGKYAHLALSVTIQHVVERYVAKGQRRLRKERRGGRKSR